MQDRDEGGEGRDEMYVIVMERTRDGWPIGPRAIQISDKCPVCGGPRGEPVDKRFCEDGEWYSVNTWTNPCGHVDKYADVLREAGR